jgi:hypothetical protein
MRVVGKLRGSFELGGSHRLEGYPVLTRKKMRACLVTYRHSAEQQFEKPRAPRAKVKEL